MRVFGIPNCDTVKKARTWLTTQGVEFIFVDLRKDGIEPSDLDSAFKALGSVLFNQRAPSWRALDKTTQQALLDGDLKAVHDSPTVLKRPLVNHQGEWFNSFNETDWQSRLSN